MGQLTSVYLHDGLQAAVKASGTPLAELIRRGLTSAPPRRHGPHRRLEYAFQRRRRRDRLSGRRGQRVDHHQSDAGPFGDDGAQPRHAVKRELPPVAVRAVAGVDHAQLVGPGGVQLMPHAGPGVILHRAEHHVAGLSASGPVRHLGARADPGRQVIADVGLPVARARDDHGQQRLRNPARP